MRIVFLVDQIYMHGGIERVLSIKANYLADIEGYEINIITTEQKNKPYCYSLSNKINIKDIGINYIRNKSYFHPINLSKVPNHIQKIKKELNSIKPDVVVVCSHSTDTYFIPFLVKKIPKIKEFHFSKYIEEKTRNSKKITFKKVFLKFADYVQSKYDRLVVLNETEATYYKSSNKEIISNPLTFFPENVSELTNNIVISVGRIAPVKGYDQLIDIWKLVSEVELNWELHIYGDGDKNYIEKLQQQIKKNKLSNNIYLKGSCENIKEKMLNSSIFVMTSLNECFPLVLLEAQSSGLPIISYDCPFGPRNIIKNESGILVELHNTNNFANELISLIQNKNMRLIFGKNARENSKQYKIEHVMNLWKKMFTNLINNTL